MHLYPNSHIATDENSYKFRGKIHVENGDQFIPIVLASTSREVMLDKANGTLGAIGSIQSTIYNSRIFRTFGDRSNIEKKVLRETMKRQLQVELQDAYPSSYTIPTPPAGATVQGNGANLVSHFIGDHIKTRFVCNAGSTWTVGFGIIGRVHNQDPYYSTITELHNYQTQICFDGGQIFAPTLLVVVKAKFLSVVRASIYLQQPLSLPFGALKVLKSRNSDPGADTVVSSPEFQHFMSTQSPEVVYMSASELIRYVRPSDDIRKSREQILADAIMVAENPTNKEWKCVVYE